MSTKIRRLDLYGLREHEYKTVHEIYAAVGKWPIE
jgi:hypothetical protein